MNKKIAWLIGKLSVTIIALSLICYTAIDKSLGWFTRNVSVESESDLIYSISQGYSGDFTSYEPFELKKIFETGDVIGEAVFVPGDIVYYSFIFSCLLDDLTGKVDIKYNVKLNLDAHTNPNYIENQNGDYLSFLKNLCIEENGSRLVVLERGTEIQNDEEINYYLPVSYSNNDGSFVRSQTGSIAYFDSETVGAPFLSTGINGLSDGESEDSINAEIEIDMPILAEYPTYSITTDGITNTYVAFMVYIPIWYIDTLELQNNEMSSTLEIMSCIITPVEEDTTE